VQQFLDYFRCANHLPRFETRENLSADSGFFRFGPDAICYGRASGGSPPVRLEANLPDTAGDFRAEAGRVQFPFDFSSVIDNLRHERYAVDARSSLARLTGGNGTRQLYYLARPLLPFAVRKRLQRTRLSGWRTIGFPRWPVDVTVDCLMEEALSRVLEHLGATAVPFIWFWPDGASSCAMMTHDVESAAGLGFCDTLMDIDESFDIKSSFQIVPRKRYDVSGNALARFHQRGFEVNVHDLNHDGSLFGSRQQFLKAAVEINRYAKAFGSSGFRSGAMYRNQDWLGALDISYDMSVPNVAHLEPQRGGCCTVMPYFIGDVLELPLTTVQDYSLFHILGDYSIELWRRQINMIRERHGLMTFLSHPDYLIERRSREVYVALLSHLAQLRQEGDVWFALPREVDRWWRNRRQLQLVRGGNGWRIEGPDSERARVAYATRNGDRIVYLVAETAGESQVARAARVAGPDRT